MTTPNRKVNMALLILIGKYGVLQPVITALKWQWSIDPATVFFRRPTEVSPE